MERFWKRMEEIGKHVLLIGLALLTLVPIVWMVSISLRSEEYVFSGHLVWTGPLHPENYVKSLTEVPFFRWLVNSLRIGVLQTLGQMFVGVCAAFAFAYYRFPGRDVLFLFVLMTMMIPMQVTLVPTYLIVNQMNALNTLAGVIVPHLASGFAIFLLRQSFLAIPKELAEAAAIDGGGAVRVLWTVYIRMSGTMLWTLGVIAFMANFNEFNWPLLVLTDPDQMPLPLAFQYFRTETQMDWGATMAIAALSMVPVLVLYLAAQRHIVDGFAQSGLKG
ncbi:sn-glycerol-3-phosphate transport system permease protein UgpE [Paenibacillus macerans]|uniref:carbohydrate ABC transporter permease n=1 Tax=Paenibacillus macerans TaxID=44252 RepID=UPI002084BB00|nr:carbohydrate ABC transporter permease [Paenibacillus macerans]MED4953167.1 carbohydrate ABC transporter permease [Paenibacillus macerans]GJM74406.1 sn-glycerol-3-phosphate transport system permease protein UgpE [Paenibacillus macerans]